MDISGEYKRIYMLIIKIVIGREAAFTRLYEYDRCANNNTDYDYGYDFYLYDVKYKSE
jgi:hypothetical protein